MPVQPYIATERLYLDSQGRVVKHDDPNKRSLLVGVGGMIPFERAKELGLVSDGEKAKEDAPVNKAKAKAPANKAKGGE